jgi:hypothetical protein
LALINDPQAIALAKQLLALYMTVKKTQNDKCVCDICGVDFTDAPYYRKPRPGARGFADRPDVSPVLCMRHKTGWGLTLQNASYGHPSVDETNSEQVDLLFAQYLAKHLLKYSNQLRRH